jgi:hypothetical protein
VRQLPLARRETNCTLHSGPMLFAGAQVGDKGAMPNLMHLLQMARSWRIDAEEPATRIGSSTPIITVLPSVEVPEKIHIYPEDKAEAPEQDRTRPNPIVSNRISIQRLVAVCSRLISVAITRQSYFPMLECSIRLLLYGDHMAPDMGTLRHTP